jgi:hypothetical protein
VRKHECKLSRSSKEAGRVIGDVCSSTGDESSGDVGLVSTSSGPVEDSSSMLGVRDGDSSRNASLLRRPRDGADFVLLGVESANSLNRKVFDGVAVTSLAKSSSRTHSACPISFNFRFFDGDDGSSGVCFSWVFFSSAGSIDVLVPGLVALAKL